MDRALRAPSFADAAWRLLTPLLIVALLLSAGAAMPATVEAGGSGPVAALRTRQIKAEAAVLRADKQIAKLQKQRRNHAKLLKKAKRKFEQAKNRRDRAGRKADSAHARLDRLKLTLARSTKVRPNPTGKQAVDKPALRKQVRKQKQAVKRLEKKLRKAQKRVEKARTLKQSRLKKPTRERIAKRATERERAEDRLAGAIGTMLSRSQDRLGWLGTATGAGFRKPVAGTISQRYGCTGYGTNPRRGSCRHFHDGVDIAAPVGRRVKASADGIVAYVGYSPWDNGARAFVVIVAHPGGYRSVYAHLKPTRKVRAGQKVERGEVVGAVGMTGLTTGPHVHWELYRGRATLNPLKAGM